MSPGRHVLELTATRRFGNDTAESPRSNPLVLIVGSGEVTSAAGGERGASTDRDRGPSPAALISCSITATEDAVFVARSSGTIQQFTIGNGQSAIQSALANRQSAIVWRPPSGEPLIVRSIAAHPDYAHTHWMYLLFSAPASHRLVLARYREVDGVLGEAAVLFESRITTTTTRPVLRFGPEGRIYIALLTLNLELPLPTSNSHLPSSRSRLGIGNLGVGTLGVGNSGVAAPFLLRLNEDGSVPRDNPSGSPQLDLQARAPSAVAWDEDGRLWVLERAANGSRLQRPSADAGERVAMTDVVSMGFLSQNARWFVGADGRIAQMQPGGKLRIVRAGSATRRIGDALVTPEAIVACDALRPELDIYPMPSTQSR